MIWERDVQPEVNEERHYNRLHHAAAADDD